MKKLVALCISTVLAPAFLQAAVITIYDGEQATFVDDLAAFNASQDLGDGILDGVVNVVAPTAFGTGDAMRMFDFNTADKPELQGETATALTSAYRIDFQGLNNSVASSTKAIRFRMANTGKSISSESRSAFSLSWQADGKVTAKYSDGGLNDGDANDVDTKSTDALIGVHDVTIIGNNDVSATYAYSLFGESRTLNAQSYDVYIDGVLLNSGSDAWYANGMKYTLEKSAADYDPALGIQRFGLIGSGNSDVDPDIQFDNIILRTGTDIIPEPAALGLMALVSTAFFFIRRRFVV